LIRSFLSSCDWVEKKLTWVVRLDWFSLLDKSVSEAFFRRENVAGIVSSRLDHDFLVVKIKERDFGDDLVRDLSESRISSICWFNLRISGLVSSPRMGSRSRRDFVISLDPRNFIHQSHCSLVKRRCGGSILKSNHRRFGSLSLPSGNSYLVYFLVD
jgi:hypothetical protein